MSHEDRIRQRQIERLRQKAGKGSDATASPDDRVFSDDAREKLTAAGQGLSKAGKGLFALGQKAARAAVEKAREAKADLDAKRAVQATEAPPLAPGELAVDARPAAQAHDIAVRLDEAARLSDLAEEDVAQAALADAAHLLDAQAESQDVRTVPASDRQRHKAAGLNTILDARVSHSGPTSRPSGESIVMEPEDAIGLEADTAPAALEGAAQTPTMERGPQDAPVTPTVAEEPRYASSPPSNRPLLRTAPLIAGAVLALAAAASLAWWATRHMPLSNESGRPNPVQAEPHEAAPPAAALEMSSVAEPDVIPDPEAGPVVGAEQRPPTAGTEPATAAPAPEPKAKPAPVAKPAAPKPVRQAMPKPTPAAAPEIASPTWQDEADADMDAWMRQR